MVCLMTWKLFQGRNMVYLMTRNDCVQPSCNATGNVVPDVYMGLVPRAGGNLERVHAMSMPELNRIQASLFLCAALFVLDGIQAGTLDECSECADCRPD